MRYIMRPACGYGDCRSHRSVSGKPRNSAIPRRRRLAIDLLLKGGIVVTEGDVVRADVAISEGKIIGIIAPGESNQAKRVVDIDGLHLLPGLIDMHSHHREPGFTHKEDLITATKCCAAGGVTVSVGMPNVSPSPTTAEILKDIFALYREKAIVDYNMNPAATVLEEI